jgi:cysteinyl-tRNA synthetase
MTLPRMSSSGLSRGSSDLRVSALVDGWMAGTSPAMTVVERVQRIVRKVKNFKESDRIRDELSAMGIQLKDAKDPATGETVTTWEVRASGTTEVKR